MTEQPPSQSRAHGALVLTLSTVVAALLGWVTLLVVAHSGGESVYAGFAILWGTYYGLAGIFAGLQHEVTRARVEGEAHGGSRGRSPLAWATAAIGALLALLTVATFPLWRSTVDADLLTAGALVLGVGGLTGLVVVLGLLAAARRWRALAALLLADAVMRLIAVATVIEASDSAAAHVAAISGASWVWVPLLILGSRATSLRADLGLRLARREFWTRAAAAMTATGCASLIIAGFPWLIAMTSRGPVDAQTSGLLAALVLFRSPILMVVYGLRPIILRDFLSRPAHVAARVGRVWVFSVLVGGLVTVGAFAVGPTTLRATFGEGFDITRVQAAGLVTSAMLLTMATLSSMAFVAVAEHRSALGGWVMAVGATLLVLVLPLDDGPRAVWAAIAGPFVAVAWHGLRLAAGHRADVNHQGGWQREPSS